MDVKAVLKELVEIKEDIELYEVGDMEKIEERVRKLRDDQTAIKCPESPPCICDQFDDLRESLLDGERYAIEEYHLELACRFVPVAKEWIKDTLELISESPDMDHHEREVYHEDVDTLEELIEELVGVEV